MCFIDNMAIKQLHLGKTSVVKHWAKKKIQFGFSPMIFVGSYH